MNNSGQFFIGVVEDRFDPLQAGRVRVRVVGLHYHEKEILPTEDLPWALVMQPITTGTTISAVGPAEGTTVIVIFEDYPDCQYPIVIGAIAGVPQGDAVNIDKFEAPPVWKDNITPQGRPLPNNEDTASGGISAGPIPEESSSSSSTQQEAPNTDSLYGTSVTQLQSPSGSTTSTAPTGGVNSAGSGNTNSPKNTSSTTTSNGVNNNTPSTSSNTFSSIPALSSIVESSFAKYPETTHQLMSAIIEPGVQVNKAIGGIVEELQQLGSELTPALNEFTNSVEELGNIDDAINQFKQTASQISEFGNAISEAFNGFTSLDKVAQSFGLDLGAIQDSVSEIISPISSIGNQASSALSSITGSISSIGNQASSALSSITGPISSVADQLSSSTSALNDSISSISDLIENSSDSINKISSSLGNLGINAGLGSVTNASTALSSLSAFGIDTSSINKIQSQINNVTNTVNTVSNAVNSLPTVINDLQDIKALSDVSNALDNVFGSVSSVSNVVDSLGKIGGLFGDSLSSLSKSVNDVISKLSEPPIVATTVNGLYASSMATPSNIGNINVTVQKPPSQCVIKDFQQVIEGKTPPINGAFGGPNFGGHQPIIAKPKPTQVLDERIEKGTDNNHKPLNTSPPPSFESSAENIQLLLSACQKHGLTTKEQQAAFLGIIGGESYWKCVEEDCYYSSTDHLVKTFASTFKGKPTLAKKYTAWKGSKKEFFDIVYDPANNGSLVGNKQPGDGGKYYGRGFLQITGKRLYERFALLTGKPLDKQPELALDPELSAEIAVLYFMENVKNVNPSAHPGYFLAAIRAVGNNSEANFEKKKQFYEHFYNGKCPDSYGASSRTAGSHIIPSSYDGSMQSNIRFNPNWGFQDPNGKYPLNQVINEPHINRMARSSVRNTIVLDKQNNRVLGIPTAFGGTWDQPEVPYAAQYPYNHVRETESGHVQEFDDTPGYERIHTMHRTGTFEEIDPEGSKVTRVVGDKYEILDRNGFISILGEANVTVSGQINVLCQSDAHIEVAGSSHLRFGGNLNIGVADDLNIAVQGNTSIWSNGNMNLQAKGKGHIRTNDNMFISSSAELHTYSEKNTFIAANMDIHSYSKLNTVFYAGQSLTSYSVSNTLINSNANIETKSTADTKMQADGNYHTLAKGTLNTQSQGALSIKSGGDIGIDGSKVQLNSGTATDAEEASNVASQNQVIEKASEEIIDQQQPPPPPESSSGASGGSESSEEPPPFVLKASKAIVYGMVPPPHGMTLNRKMDPLVAPPRHGEENYLYEKLDDDEPEHPVAKKHVDKSNRQNKKSNTNVGESVGPSGSGTGNIKQSPNKSAIVSGTNASFNRSYRLSKRFTLGMLITSSKHVLESQHGVSVRQIVANLATISENILEVYGEIFPGGFQGYGKSWVITSGYRLQKASGKNSAKNSDHYLGRACDIALRGVSGMTKNKKTFELIQQIPKHIPSWDQLIIEYNVGGQCWIHTGFRGTSTDDTYGSGVDRKQCFTLKNHITKYEKWLLLSS
jgi:predicted chitinase/methyl-accepting chemotaxis protein